MAVAGAAAVALALTACGSSSSSSSSSTSPSGGSITSTKDATVAALVPASIASKGTITFATDASYAPNEFFDTDGKTIIGMDIDLGNALAQTMGLQAKWVNASFDSIIPGLTAAKYDIGMSSFTDTKARQQQVDMVTYFTAGTSYAFASGNPKNVSLNNLCGLTIAVQSGTVQVTDLQARSAACTKAGKAAITLTQLTRQTDVNLAVISGKASAEFADSPVVAYAVAQSNGQLQLSSDSYDNAPYGIAIPKTPGMAKAFQAATQLLMGNGIYLNILKKWGVQAGAITTSQINPATS
jgi:polar amino acid transport system substrate-binding protein